MCSLKYILAEFSIAFMISGKLILRTLVLEKYMSVCVLVQCFNQENILCSICIRRQAWTIIVY